MRSSQTHEFTPRSDQEFATLRTLGTFVRAALCVIVPSVMISVFLAVLYISRSPPEYVATAQLMIETHREPFAVQDNNYIDLTIDNAQVESQVEIIKSERIANAVIEKLHLISDPEFGPAERRPGDPKLSAVMKPVVGSRSAAEHQQAVEIVSKEFVRRRIVLAHFMDALTAHRIGQSYVIEIAFRSKDPKKVARVTNAVANAYIQDQLDAKAVVARQAGQWMQTSIIELAEKLNEAAKAVQEFRSANGILDNSSYNLGDMVDKLTELEARALAYRRLYESFLEKLTESRDQESYPVSNARVIAAASTPLVKTYPKSKLILALAMVGGLTFGMGIAAIRSALDRAVRSPTQLRELGIDCLGSLPRYRRKRGNSRFRAPSQDREEVLEAPFSAYAEAMRSIKVHLQNTCPPEKRRIGLLSLAPGEGSSTVALSLSTVFAASGLKTVLVDADFRRRAVSRKLVPDAKAGLLDALKGNTDQTFKYVAERAIYILPLTASTESIANSSDHLGSPQMQKLLLALRGGFELVVVDLPALSAVVDARAIGPLLDGCILVVAWGRTPLESVTEAVALLQAEGITLIGAVINKHRGSDMSSFGLRVFATGAGVAGTLVRPAEGVPAE